MTACPFEYGQIRENVDYRGSTELGALTTDRLGQSCENNLCLHSGPIYIASVQDTNMYTLYTYSLRSSPNGNLPHFVAGVNSLDLTIHSQKAHSISKDFHHMFYMIHMIHTLKQNC